MIGATVLALGVAFVVTTLPGAINIPAPVTVNEHSVTKHPEAVDIVASLQTGDYKCLRVYRSVPKNRLLYRLTYANMNLEGGIIATLSGKHVTAYMRTAAGWDSVIVRDGFVLVFSNGKCGEVND